MSSRTWCLACILALAPASAAATPPLRLPWACGDVHQVTNGHHTNTHTGKDEYAWDFGLAVGTEVRAPADGVVTMIKMDSSQGGCDSAYANDANYVVLDFGDGTEGLHMHLQHASSPLHVGDVVEQGDLVGKVGLTGWVCGAHLHFQVQHDCGSWWCQSIAAEFVDFGDPDEGVPMASNNCPATEPCTLALDGTSTTIDDGDDRCFERVSSWFWDGDGGIADGHVYTWTNDGAEADTLGIWNFGVDVPGAYRVAAHVPEAQAASQAARYEIQTGAAIVTVGPVDQSASKGWVDLGVHDFVAGDEHWVRLRDNTGEPRSLDRELAFDAIRIELEPIGDDGDAGTEGSGGSSTGAPGTSDDGGTPSDPGTSSTSAASGEGSDGAGASTDHGGCAVSPARGGTAAISLLVLVLGGCTRRRSTRR